MSSSLEFDGEFRTSPTRGSIIFLKKFLPFCPFISYCKPTTGMHFKWKLNSCVYKVTGFSLACENTCDEKPSSTKVQQLPRGKQWPACQRLQYAKLNYMCMLTNERPTWCHLLFYFTYYVLNIFRTLIYPSSGACDCVDELPHPSSCSVKTDDLALM